MPHLNLALGLALATVPLCHSASAAWEQFLISYFSFLSSIALADTFWISISYYIFFLLFLARTVWVQILISWDASESVTGSNFAPVTHTLSILTFRSKTKRKCHVHTMQYMFATLTYLIVLLQHRPLHLAGEDEVDVCRRSRGSSAVVLGQLPLHCVPPGG